MLKIVDRWPKRLMMQKRPANILECGGKAVAATPLSCAPDGFKHSMAFCAYESGVALRFPPHSMTRSVVRRPNAKANDYVCAVRFISTPWH
jgi:hypothetical protein